ncbi:LLM class flavin-dependent oxidoreductase [Rhodococcus sp. G-MC3]|uniref:LLM class flavin-dependent oxidoreductase n=1 Tax=Rhodococcus sp. G-MC3 TaxID=3046209 RepID=UPI0024B92762|nr:LLM class flavin-dependent oxidoreductase [Rhodococcus sp. G-MC3]MDJ0393287.1 LLM class flavin-dependent oxidoreductase [Rhodococcus sp. G-MC3]
MPEKTFIVAVDLQGTGVHPQAWRRTDSRAEELFTAQYWTGLIEQADSAGVDLVFIPDSFALQSADGSELGRLDAASIAARAAAPTHSIGLVPTVTVTHTEPFHVSKQIASIDFASHGRAGWEVSVSESDAETKSFGRKGVQSATSLWAEADDAIEVVSRLWDSWEDDAEIRDVSTGRFIDRDKLHYIDFEGEHFSVRGPSITPRSPQGQSLVVIRATSDSLKVAAQRADIVRIAAPTVDEASVIAARVRRAVVTAGRDPANVHVLLDLDVLVSDSAGVDLAQLNGWGSYTSQSVSFVGESAGLVALLGELEAVVDGVTLRPLALASALPAIAGVVSQLNRRSTSGLLRERLGLTRPANRYAAKESAK